nr:Rha family transcriptional regulator [Campylobacter vulpis]
MSDLVVINGINVEFEVVGDQTFTTSLDIAAVFEKRCDNIIAQIKALPQDEFNALNFKAVKYKDGKGEIRPCYNLATLFLYSLWVLQVKKLINGKLSLSKLLMKWKNA